MAVAASLARRQVTAVTATAPMMLIIIISFQTIAGLPPESGAPGRRNAEDGAPGTEGNAR